MLKLLEAAIIVLIILDFFIPSTFPGRLKGRVVGGWMNMEVLVIVCASQARNKEEKGRVYVCGASECDRWGRLANCGSAVGLTGFRFDLMRTETATET